MAACKECGEIYGVFDLKDGVCKNCLGLEGGHKNTNFNHAQPPTSPKPSNKLGKTLIVVGVILGIVGMFFDTTVSTGMGSRVHNIGLMNLQSNILIVAGLLLIIGTLITLLKPKNKEAKTTNMNKSEQLIKLGEMLDKGFITKEEFDKQKKELM